jgi:hypothetical protein
MSASRTIDVHAHIIEPETVRLLQNAAMTNSHASNSAARG